MYGDGVADDVVARAVAQPSPDWWRSTRGFATWLTWLLAAQAAFQLLTPVLTDQAPKYVQQHRAFEALLDGRNQEANRLFRQANSGFNAIVLLGYVSIAVLVVMIIWMWRSAHNARALGRTGARLAPGWAIASWFIPVASWVLLYLLLSDLWRSSEPGSTRGDAWRQLPGPAWVRVWVVLHAGGSILTFGTVGLALTGVTGESATRVLLIAAAVVSAAGTLATIVVVRRITDRQAALQAADPAPTERPLSRQFLAPTTVDGPGWYPDPSRRFDHRYYDGTAWTEHVSVAGVASTAPVTPPDWYPDPTGRFDWRYWTGTAWTEHVSRDQQLYLDPISGDAP